MSYLKMFLMILILLLFPLDSNHGSAKEAARLNYKEPLEMHEMKEYENILFKVKNFEKIKRGMTETEVLNLLGKPLNLKKIKRKKTVGPFDTPILTVMW